MRSLILTSVLALAFSTVAQPTEGFDTLSSPPDQAHYAVGDNLPILWDPETLTDSITLTLIGGPTKNLLNPIKVIARESSNFPSPIFHSRCCIPTNIRSPANLANQLGNYSWPIPVDVGTYASYGVNLTDNTNTTLFQYSNQFYITGGEAAGTDTSSTSLPPSTSSTGTTSTGTPSASTTTSSGTTSSSSTPTTTKTTGTTSSSTSAGPASTSSKAAAATGSLSGGLAVLGGLALALAL
jgi:hypothetical protein